MNQFLANAFVIAALGDAPSGAVDGLAAQARDNDLAPGSFWGRGKSAVGGRPRPVNAISAMAKDGKAAR